MTIDGLNPLTTLTAGDELPVWDVEASAEEPTKKITAQNMAASVKTLGSLVNTSEMNSALAGKQNTLTFDTTPTTGSTNPVTSGGVASAIAQSTAYTEVGTRNSNVNANSSCIRCGNIVVCNIRYDAAADVAVYTGLPKALKAAWARIRSDDTHWGVLEIAAGQTSLNYANKGATSTGAKIGQLVYIVDNN